MLHPMAPRTQHHSSQSSTPTLHNICKWQSHAASPGSCTCFWTGICLWRCFSNREFKYKEHIVSGEWLLAALDMLLLGRRVTALTIIKTERSSFPPGKLWEIKRSVFGSVRAASYNTLKICRHRSGSVGKILLPSSSSKICASWAQTNWRHWD